MKLKILENIDFFKLLLLSTYIICWLSISTSFDDLLNFKENDLNLREIINFSRHGLVYICLLALIFFTIFFRKNINFKKYLIFYFFIAYLLAQLPGLFFTDNSISNISFIISGLTLTFSIVLISNFFDLKEKKILLIISLIILVIVFFLTFIPLFYKFLNGGGTLYSSFSTKLTSQIFLDKLAPRTSGLARIALLILILTHLMELASSTKVQNKLVFVKIFFITTIFLFQSRTIFFITYLFYLFIFLSNEKITFKKFIKFLGIYFLIPLFLFLSLSMFNTYKKAMEVINSRGLDDTATELMLSEYDINYDIKFLRKISPNDPSSGRFQDWERILKSISNENYLYGYGSQGDRYLINQSASNGLIYAFSSSGFIGLIIFIIFSSLVCLKIFKIFFYNFKNKNIYFLYSSIISALGLRSIFETSYAVFSIDLIVFLTVLSFINEIKDFKTGKLK